MLRHGRSRLGRSKDRKTDGDATTDSLAPIKDSFGRSEKVLSSIGSLEGDDRGSDGVDLGTCTRSSVRNGRQIVRCRHGFDA